VRVYLDRCPFAPVFINFRTMQSLFSCCPWPISDKWREIVEPSLATLASIALPHISRDAPSASFPEPGNKLPQVIVFLWRESEFASGDFPTRQTSLTDSTEPREGNAHRHALIGRTGDKQGLASCKSRCRH
jgi:hypothetical protein